MASWPSPTTLGPPELEPALVEPAAPHPVRLRPSVDLRRLLTLLMGMLLVIGLLGVAAHQVRGILEALASDPAAVVVLQAPEEPRTTPPMTIVVAIDRSSSMEASDPHDLRLRQPAEAVRWLADHGDPDDRVAVLHFAGGTATAAPSRVRLHGEEIIQQLTATPGLDTGYNPFLPMLQQAAQLLDQPEGQSVLVLLTDGVPDLVEDPRRIQQGLDLLPAGTAVHVLAADADGGWTRASEHWVPNEAIASVTPIREPGARALAQPLVEILQQHTGQTIPQQGRP